MDSPRRRARNENCATVKSLQYYGTFYEKEIDGVKNKMYPCKLCESELNGNKQHNLVAHLQNVHPETFDLIADKKQDIKVDRLEFLQNIVEMVTVNGRPFKSISDSGFQSIIQNQLRKFDAAGCALNLSDPKLPEVKKELSEMACRVRDKIKEEVHRRALALLIDIGTKNRRSIFAISIQYTVNGRLRTRSIGMIELQQSNTGKYLAGVIRDQLTLFGIDVRQILTITTDNGKNVLKMIRDFDAIVQDEIEQNTSVNAPPETTHTQSEEDFDDIEADDEINQLLTEMDSDEGALEEIFEESLFKRHENLLNEMSRQLVTEFGLDVLWDITGVNCSAHTLQLVIKDALLAIDKKHRNVISLCRNVAKFLRLKSTKHAYKTHGQNYTDPRLDVVTRWGSTYMMVWLVIFYHLYLFSNSNFYSRYMTF